MKTRENSQTGWIDVCRLWMAILVVILHTTPFSIEGKDIYEMIRNWFSYMAVPFFFCCTGYFAYYKKDWNYATINLPKKILKFIKLYLIWTVIYAPIIFYREIYKFEGGMMSGFLDWGIRFFVRGSYIQLWYLLGCVYALFFVWTFLKHNWKKQLYVTAGILYSINTILTSYTVLLPQNMSVQLAGSKIWELIGGDNGLLFGMIFILVGIKLFDEKQKQGKTVKEDLLKLFGSVVLYTIEYITIYQLAGESKHLLFTMPFVIYYLFCVLLHIKCGISNVVCVHIRKLTALIFYLHTFIICVVNVISEFWDNTEDMTIMGNHFCFFIVVLLVTIICAEILMWLSQKKIFSFLKKIY